MCNLTKVYLLTTTAHFQEYLQHTHSHSHLNSAQYKHSSIYWPLDLTSYPDHCSVKIQEMMRFHDIIAHLRCQKLSCYAVAWKNRGVDLREIMNLVSKILIINYLKDNLHYTLLFVCQDFREAVVAAVGDEGEPVLDEERLWEILNELPDVYTLHRRILTELENRIRHW